LQKNFLSIDNATEKFSYDGRFIFNLHINDEEFDDGKRMVFLIQFLPPVLFQTTISPVKRESVNKCRNINPT